MDAEFLQLAREAVAALQTGPPPNWTEIAGLAVSAAVGFGQISLIAWGLRQMRLSGERRDRQLDLMETAQREQSERLGTAFDRQGAALERQGEVLAELLRRTA